MANLKIKLLPDEPTDRDEFDSHDNVAKTITALISGDADGGKAIGITGSWGSGKSTVVEIVKAKLAKLKDCETLVFQFDAWTHQDDPPRRAFLETLHQFLLDSPYTGDEAERQGNGWKQEINAVVGKAEISTTTTQKEIAPVGALIAILLLVTVPLAGAVGNKLGLRYGFGLVLLPVLVAAVAVLVDWWVRPPESVSVISRSEPEGKKKPALSNQLLRALLRDTVETKTAETEKANDATSTDFRRVFSMMLDAVLLPKNRRVLIVVDYLDRVDALKALSIWSTMRIFFELDARSCAWKSKFWLIAPFDPAALKRLWAADTHAEEPGALVESFINKTFQVTFRVSPPVVARWRDFFERNFIEAFLEEQTRREWRTIYRLYDRFTTQSSFRDIKLFLNKLAVLYLQWEEKIPLAFLALYLLIAPKTKDNVLEIITGRQPGDDVAEAQPPGLVNAAVLEVLPPITDALGKAEPDGWKKLIAAIHFNVAPTDVVHALIGNDLQQAIAAGDAATIKRLAQSPDFWTACEKVIEDRLPELVGTPALLTTLRLLYDATPRELDSEPAAQRVMTNLSERAAKLSDWDFGAVSLVNEIILGGRHDDYEEFKRNVLSAARKVPRDPDEGWMLSVEAALDALHVERFEFEAAEATDFVKATHQVIHASAQRDWSVTTTPAGQAYMLDALRNYTGELKSGELQPLVECLLPLASADDWEQLRADWVAQVEAGEKGMPLFIEAALAIPTAGPRQRRQLLNSLAVPAVGPALLSSIDSQEWQAAAFYCVALFADVQSAGEEYGHILQRMAAGEYAELYQAFLATICLVKLESMLLVPGLEQAATAGVARRAIVDLSRPPDEGAGTDAPQSARFEAVGFVSRYRRLTRLLGQNELAEIVATLVRSSDLLDILCRTGRFRLGRASLYQLALRTQGRERVLPYLLESILKARAVYIARALQLNPEFRGLFVELLDAVGTGWLSVELADTLGELDAVEGTPAGLVNPPPYQPPPDADAGSDLSLGRVTLK